MISTGYFTPKQWISPFSQVHTEHSLGKITQKSLTFLYTNNEKTEGEIKETIPFTIAMKRIKYFSSVQLLSHVRLFATPWTAARQASLFITISQSLLKLMSIKSVMPPNHLILCHPLPFMPSIFSSIRVFSNELALCMRWPEYWSFSFIISPFNGYSGLISFGMDWLDLLVVQGTLKSLLQHHSSKASILWHSAFFMVQL